MTRASRTNKTVRLVIITLAVIAGVELLSYLFKNTGYEGREVIFYLRCLELIILIGIWGFRAKKEWIKNLTLSFISVGFMLLLLDFIFFILIIIKVPEKSPTLLPPASSFVVKDKDLGYVPMPDKIFNPVVKFDTFTLYNIHFTTDHFSRRINPFDTNKVHKKYALFFGCSITFGEGVNDSETFPARFAQDDKDYHSYNFGYSGYGPQQMLANLQKANLKDEIKEKDGVAFYTYISPHINRAIGDMQTYNAWGAEMPYYYEKDDSIVRKGTFTSGRWFVSKIYTLLGRSSIIKYFKINIPFKIRERHYRFVAKMIKASYNQYVKTFENENFYIIIFPGETEDMIPYLKEQNLKYLDYTRLFDRWNPKYCFMPYDMHPRPVADAIFAKQLSKDIKILDPK